MILVRRMQNQFTGPIAIARPGLLLLFTLSAALGCDIASQHADQGTTHAGPPPSPVAATAPLAASRSVPLPKVLLDDPSDILLISVDTLRPDHLSLYGYRRSTSPAIDRFFQHASLYQRAYSSEANTSPSVVSMLSGLYPARHRVRFFYQRIPAQVPVLSDYLAAAGYQTAAVVSNVVLTREAIGLSTRFDHYDDFVDEREARLDVFERRASRTTDAALTWLEDMRDAGRPHFLWVHYIDPHGPYRPPEESALTPFRSTQRQPIDLQRVVPYQRDPTLSDGARYIDRYDDEIAYVDSEIGRLLARYREIDPADQSIVIFTADHGENLIEHDVYFNHGHQVWESIMRVPLAIRWPGGRAESVEVPVSLVDLAPSVLDALGYPEAPRALAFDGKPLRERRAADAISLEASGRAGRGDPTHWVYRHHRALVSGDEKWFASVDREGAVVARGRFDLAADPGETSPEPWYFGGKGNTLLRWFEADPDVAGIPATTLKGERLSGPKVAPGRTPEQLRALRALGYVE